MQRLKSSKLANWLRMELRFLIVFFSLLAASCEGTNGQTSQSGVDKPLTGTTLKVSCPDAGLRALIEPMTRVWSHTTGAKVELLPTPMTPDDGVDLGIIGFAELGTWAERGELVPVPAALRETGHPLQWSSILSAYRGEPFAGWGGQTFGVPLAADGHVILYRSDRFADPQAKDEFRKRFNRMLAAPTTWEEFAEVAAFFSERDKRPGVVIAPERVYDLFFRVAACYDRPVRTGDAQESAESLAFQFRLDNGKSRIDGPGFAVAGRWMAGNKGFAEGDPVAAFEADRSVLGVISLHDLIRLKRDGKMPTRYSVAQLPGTRSVMDASGKMVIAAGNYVPFFSGGWLGVVRRGCKNPEAAFALLAELGGPTRSQEIVASGGYGPIRDTHLEADRLLVWLGYGFDDARSKALQEALRSYVGKSVRNPTYDLRTPDQVALRSSMMTELKKIASGEVKAEDGLKRVAEGWNRNAEAPQEKLLEWRRRAAGLN